MSETPFLNISSYKFLDLPAEGLPQLKYHLLNQATELQLKGTILLSTEGINMFLSGLTDNMKAFQQFLKFETEFKDLTYKDSYSKDQPFTRMLVRIKKEIISMGCPTIRPMRKTAPHLDPQELKAWYEQNKDMVILDTRNDYELRLGTFENAVDLNIKSFRAFPEAIKKLPEEFRKKPVVTFCTGGIRCEKAAQYMLDEGFEEVYQLDGGILNYFEKVGGDHYEGECFVFDKRVAVDPSLEETDTVQCYACRSPITVKEQKQSKGECPYCGHTEFLKGKWVN